MESLRSDLRRASFDTAIAELELTEESLEGALHAKSTAARCTLQG